MIGLLVATATLGVGAPAFADVPAETLPPAPAPIESPAAAEPPSGDEAAVAEPPPPVVVEQAPAAAPPPAAAPLATEPVPESPPAAAAPPAPELTTAVAPRSTGERRARVVGAPPGPAPAGDAPGEAEPECVVTAPDGSCALESTDCDVLGDDGDNELFGTPNGGIICGLGGNDLLESRGGDDILVGGPGADRYSGDDEDCVIPDDDDVEPLRLRLCVFNNGRYYNLRPPPTDTGPPGGVEGGPVGAGDVASVGTLYVALTRYASTQGETQSAGAIALIATRAVRYSDGEIRFLVSCSRAGEVRVTLAALREGGRRIRLGATTFRCQGEDDDRLESVELTDEGRRLVERSTRVRIRAEIVEAGATNAADQTFVLNP